MPLSTEMSLSDIIDYQPFRGHQQPDRILAIDLPRGLAETLQAMRAYVSIVEAIEDGFHSSRDMSVICDMRNLIQHCLMSLPPASQRGAIFISTHPAYETCRIAAVIFGIGVTFPLYAETSPLRTLVKLLQFELLQQEENGEFSSDACAEFLLWALILGGIAATETSYRSWFVWKTRKVALDNGICDWYHLKRIVRSILWMDCACDLEGFKMWNEAMNCI